MHAPPVEPVNERRHLGGAQPPAPPTAGVQQTSERKIGPETVLSNEELKAFGYRTRGPGYGYQGASIPGADVPPPTEM